MINTDLVKVDDLLISQRVKNALHNANINTVTDLLSPDFSPTKTKGIGRKAYSEISVALRKYKLHLYDSVLENPLLKKSPDDLTIYDLGLMDIHIKQLEAVNIISINQLCSMTENEARAKLGSPYLIRQINKGINRLGFFFRFEQPIDDNGNIIPITQEAIINARCRIIETFHSPKVANQWIIYEDASLLDYQDTGSCISDLANEQLLTATNDYLFTISKYPEAVLDLILKTKNIPLKKAKASKVRDIEKYLTIDEIIPIVPDFGETRYIWTEKGIEYCLANTTDTKLQDKIKFCREWNYDKYILMKF